MVNHLFSQMSLPVRLSDVFSSPRKAISAVATVVALVVAALILAAFVVPRLFGLQAQVVLSGSMEPTLSTGGIAFLEPLQDVSGIREGNIITFKRPGGTGESVTHRVTQVLRGSDGRVEFKTKGDAGAVEDSWTVPAANVSGVVKWDLPYLGYLVQLARSRTGFALFILIPGGIILLGEMKHIFDHLTRDRRPA